MTQRTADLPDAFVTLYERIDAPTAFGGAYASERIAEGIAKIGGGRVVRYVPADRAGEAGEIERLRLENGALREELRAVKRRVMP